MAVSGGMTKIASCQVALFNNPLAPAGLGGAGLNARYLERAGLTRADAAAAVAVNLGAGALVHAGGLLVAIAVTGRTGVGDVRLPSGWPALIAVVAALALAGVVVWVPALRRRVLPRTLGRRVLWPAWQGVLGLRATLRRPAKAARLLGGSGGLTACYILALYASLEAFGAELPLAKVAVAYLGGAAVASVSPTPGGAGRARGGTGGRAHRGRRARRASDRRCADVSAADLLAPRAAGLVGPPPPAGPRNGLASGRIKLDRAGR
jgi:uncharacterized membrane protein YbhN (UPF0104 family)